MTSTSVQPIRALTSLRFIAALMVMLCHLTLLGRSESDTLQQLYRDWLSEGYIGVTFFFVLSGFILTHAYDERMRLQRVSHARFMWQRVARLYPIHLLTFALSLPLVWAGAKALSSEQVVVGLISNALLLQAYIPDNLIYFSANQPSWSLSVELFFYALFPLLVRLGSRQLLALLALVVAWHLGLLWHEKDLMVDHSWQFLSYIFPPARLGDFIAGILVHRVRTHVALGAWQASLAQVLAIVALPGLVAWGRDGVSPILRTDLFYLPVMAWTVYAFSFDNGIVGRRLLAPWAVYLGEISFSVYMIHQLLIRYLGVVIENAELPLSTQVSLGATVIVLLGSTLIAIGLFEKIERPAKTALLAWWDRRARPTP